MTRPAQQNGLHAKAPMCMGPRPFLPLGHLTGEYINIKNDPVFGKLYPKLKLRPELTS